MMKKSLTTAVAGVAFLGMGLATAPSAGAAPVSIEGASVQAAPRCAQYPASVVTVTRLNIAKNRVRRGGNNTATIRVSSQRGTPKGDVKVTILPADGSGREIRLFAHLQDGVAVVDLPTDMRRGRYGVQAKYIPKECSKWMKSQSDVDFYRITRRHRG